MSLSHSALLSIGGLHSVRSQSSENFMLVRPLSELTQEAQVYKECVRYYPFVLGAQPARLVDLAAFYAAIATEGARPSPHVIAAVEQNGRTIYRNTAAPIWLGSADRVAFYQLKSMLQVTQGELKIQKGIVAALRLPTEQT